MDPDIDQLKCHGALKPYDGESAVNRIDFVYSMIHLTEHPDRLHFTQVALDSGLFPPTELYFRDELNKLGANGTPVPHTISSGAFKNALPLIANCMDR